jgi:hypothetical protein
LCSSAKLKNLPTIGQGGPGVAGDPNPAREWGKYDVHLHQLIEEARESLEKEALDTGLKTERAIFAIKSKGIP